MKVNVVTKEQMPRRFSEGTIHVAIQGEVNPDDLETKKFLKVTHGAMSKWIQISEIIKVEQIP